MSGDNETVRVSDNVEGLLIKMQEFDGSVEFCTHCHMWVTVWEWNLHMHDRKGLSPLKVYEYKTEQLLKQYEENDKSIKNNPCKEVQLPEFTEKEQDRVNKLNWSAIDSINKFLDMPRE